MVELFGMEDGGMGGEPKTFGQRVKQNKTVPPVW